MVTLFRGLRTDRRRRLWHIGLRSRTVAELATKIEPQAAAEIARRGAQRLVAAMENPQETDSDRLSSLVSVLAELAAMGQ